MRSGPDNNSLGWLLGVINSKVREVPHLAGLGASKLSYWHWGGVALADDLPHELYVVFCHLRLSL